MNPVDPAYHEAVDNHPVDNPVGDLASAAADAEPADDELPDAELTSEVPADFVITSAHGAAVGVVHDGIHYHVQQTVDRLRRDQDLTRRLVAEIMATLVERAYRTRDGRQGVLPGDGVADLFELWPCLIVGGQPSSGRRRAAIALLDTVGKQIREILEPGSAPQPRIADLLDQPDTGYLLRLSPDLHHAYPDLADQLIAHQDVLRERRSYAVVVTDGESWPGVREFRGGQVLEIAPPDRRRLLDMQLRSRTGVPALEELTSCPELDTFLAHASVHEVVALAEQLEVSGARRTHTGATHAVEDIVREALGAVQRWEAEISVWFRDVTETDARVFRIAAAMLEGAPDRLVLEAATRLAALTGADPALAESIGHKGIRQLAEETRTEIGTDRRIRFHRQDYGDAILNFVYRDRSDTFRRRLWTWAAEIPLSQRMPSRQLATAVAERIMSLATTQRDTQHLRGLIVAWYRPPIEDVIVDLMTELAIRPETGSATRQRLLNWATQDANPRVLYTVADVCRGQFAMIYPDAALTRLHHLASHRDPALVEKVSAGMLALWDHVELRGRLLARIADWMAEPPGPRRDLAGRLVGALAERDREDDGPLRLVIDAPSYRSTLARIVAAGLESPGTEPGIRQAFVTWLDLHESRPVVIPYVIALLASVGQGSGAVSRRLARAHDLAYAWQPLVRDSAYPERRDLRTTLTQRLYQADPLLQKPATAEPTDEGPTKDD